MNMSTDEIKGTQNLIDDIIKKNKGPFGLTAFIISLSVLVIRLPADYITKLQDTWMIIAIPSIIVLLGSLGQAYLVEQRHRTAVEEKIYGKLDVLTEHFERMFEHNLDNKIYLDRSFDQVSDEHKAINGNVARVFKVLEKRDDLLYSHAGDTEKFLHGGK